MSAPKRFSISTIVIVSTVVSAAAFAAGRSVHDAGTYSSGATAEPAPAPTRTTTTSHPPGHPPVESSANVTPNDSPGASAESGLSWKVPAKWEVAPNASSMRLATYRVGSDAEMAVSQAGGSVDANVDRWIGQFGPEAKKSAKVTKKTISGLEVTIVEVEGAYGAKEGWGLLGAIVATRTTDGMAHFFKLTGPAKTVHDARTQLDELLASLTTK